MKYQADRLLLTANTTILIAFFFVFQTPTINKPTKWALVLSFTLYIVSLLMILWYLFRQPIRSRLMEDLREKTVKKYSKRIAAYIENIAVPLARLKTRDEFLGKLSSVKTKEEHAALISSIEKEISDLKEGNSSARDKAQEETDGYVIEGFLDQLTAASKKDYQVAFKTPLNEKYAKFKYILDRLSFKFRRHIFVSGTVFGVFSIFVELLSK